MADGGATGGHPNVGNPGNPRVFFDITIGKQPAGRIVFELYADFTPRSAENFRCLCTGERGTSARSGEKLAFAKSFFHRIIPNFMAQGGDFTRGDGTGGESIYGAKFADENFLLTHDGPGLLSLANAGPNTNGSQFFVTFGRTPHLNGKHVVFGRVESGMAVVKKLGMTPTHADDRPKYDVQIASCGQVGLGGSLEGGGEGVRGVSAVSESGAEGGGGGSGAKEDGHKEGDDGAGGDAKAPGELEEEEEEYDEAAESAANEEAMSEMTDKQKRLFKLRMSINKGRKANRAAAGEEKKRLDDPYFEAKRKAAERKAKKEEWAAEMASRGLTTAQSYLFETEDTAHGHYDRKAKKDKAAAAFGWDAFNTDTLHKAYEKRLASLPKTQSAADAARSTDAMGYGTLAAMSSSSSGGSAGGGPQDSAAALDRMAKELAAKADRNKKFSRRRAELDGADVDHINSRNAHFNKKIKRAYDKYTIEIKQDLERGTAL